MLFRCLYSSGLRYIRKHIKMFCNHLCVISKASAIHQYQYKEEIFSISTQILQRPCCFMKYFTTGNKSCNLREVCENLKFIRSKEGTHIHNREEDVILEFELFSASLEKKNNNLKVKYFFRSC